MGMGAVDIRDEAERREPRRLGTPFGAAEISGVGRGSEGWTGRDERSPAGSTRKDGVGGWHRGDQARFRSRAYDPAWEHPKDDRWDQRAYSPDELTVIEAGLRLIAGGRTPRCALQTFL